ncbi:MAG: sulfurtransferase TusA family protein [Burkholderiales bacterium]|nr:sulfurtransferase TusA family protein [Burkholderiales bacterium]
MNENQETFTELAVNELPIANREVDAIGMNCPLPILRTKKALADMQSGEILKIIATDAGAKHDFPAFAKQTGNQLIATEIVNDAFVFYLKRR